jgi:hypothetical protein
LACLEKSVLEKQIKWAALIWNMIILEFFAAIFGLINFTQIHLLVKKKRGNCTVASLDEIGLTRI